MIIRYPRVPGIKEDTFQRHYYDIQGGQFFQTSGFFGSSGRFWCFQSRNDNCNDRLYFLEVCLFKSYHFL